MRWIFNFFFWYKQIPPTLSLYNTFHNKINVCKFTHYRTVEITFCQKYCIHNCTRFYISTMYCPFQYLFWNIMPHGHNFNKQLCFMIWILNNFIFFLLMSIDKYTLFCIPSKFKIIYIHKTKSLLINSEKNRNLSTRKLFPRLSSQKQSNFST